MSKEQKEQRSWIGKEIKTADWGDERLNRRLGNILDMLSCKPTNSTLLHREIGVKQKPPIDFLITMK